MITRTRLHSSFVQYGDTCILGGYAIASNYYTDIPFLNFFKDYCKHFEIRTEENDFAEYYSRHFITKGLGQTQRLTRWISLSELNKYEIAYDESFHNVYTSRNITGLNLMKEIHDISQQKSFESSRNSFGLSYIKDVRNEIGNVNNYLEREESLSMVAFQGERGGRHIAVVGYDRNGFYMMETRPNKENGPQEIESITSLVDPGDALLTLEIR